MLAFGAPGVLGPAMPPYGSFAVAELRQRVKAMATMRDGPLTVSLALSAIINGQCSIKDAMAGTVPLGLYIVGQSAIRGTLDVLENLVNLITNIIGMSKIQEGVTFSLALGTAIKAKSDIRDNWSGSVALGFYLTANSYMRVATETIVALFQRMNVQAKASFNATGALAMSAQISAKTYIAYRFSGAVTVIMQMTGMSTSRFGTSFVANLATRIAAMSEATFVTSLSTQIRAIIITSQSKMRAGISSLNLVMTLHIGAQTKARFGLAGFFASLAARIAAMCQFGLFKSPQGGSPMADLDQGGQFATKARVWRGPTLGWIIQDIAPEIYITASPATIEAGNSIILVNFAGPCSITLPNVVEWVQNHYDAGASRTAFDRSLLIKDYFGNAGTNPITIFPYSGQNIGGFSSWQIVGNFADVKLYPAKDSTGWFVA